MTKKRFLIISMLTAMLSIPFVGIYAADVDLHEGYVDPGGDNGGQHRTPIEVPTVSLEDHTLFFETPCDGYTLRLLDEDGIVVFSTVIPSGTTSLVLPSYLSGEYEIQIIQGYLYYYGYIEL